MEEKFEVPAIVELFGHQKIAGIVTEHNFGGATFLRVDVPETKVNPKFTRFINPSAVYALNPVTKEVMEGMASALQVKPIDEFDMRVFMKRLDALKANEEAF